MDEASANPGSSTAPTPPTPPAFNPTDPLSITWYVTAVLTVLGFLLKKDLTQYAGPLAMGIFALVGIALGIVQAIKAHSFNQALSAYNIAKIDHYATVSMPQKFASHESVRLTFHQIGDDISALNARLGVLEEKAKPAPVKKTVSKTTRRARPKPPPY